MMFSDVRLDRCQDVGGGLVDGIGHRRDQDRKHGAGLACLDAVVDEVLPHECQFPVVAGHDAADVPAVDRKENYPHANRNRRLVRQDGRRRTQA